jgi:gas vesicle protein
MSTVDWIKNFVKRVWWGVAAACEWLVKVWIWMTAFIVEWLREVCRNIWILATALWEKCKVAANNICEWIYKKVNNAKRVAEEVARAIADATKSAVAWVKWKLNAWIDSAKYLYDKFNQWVTDIYYWLKDKLNSAVDAFKTIMKALEDKWQEVIDQVKSTLWNLVYW